MEVIRDGLHDQPGGNSYFDMNLLVAKCRSSPHCVPLALETLAISIEQLIGGKSVTDLDTNFTGQSKAFAMIAGAIYTAFCLSQGIEHRCIPPDLDTVVMKHLILIECSLEFQENTGFEVKEPPIPGS